MAPRTMETNLRRRISVCVFPLGPMRCVLRVSREFYPTRRHGAKPGHRPTLSVGHAVSPATRNAKPGRRTRTFPILWDMIVTGRTRMWLEDEVGTNKDKLRRWRSCRPIVDRPPPSFSRPAKSFALLLAKKPSIQLFPCSWMIPGSGAASLREDLT